MACASVAAVRRSRSTLASLVLVLATALCAPHTALASDRPVLTVGSSLVLPANDPQASGEQAGHAPAGHDAHGDGHSEKAAGPIAKYQEAIASSITAIVVFLIVMAVLGAAVWPKINAGLRDREAKIRDEIEAAERARQQAKEALAEYERSLAAARAEAKQMLEQTRAQQSAMAAELKSKADAELASLKERARREIDSARKAAVADIYQQASTLATQVASKVLRREVNAADQQRLVEESLAELASSARG